MKEQARLVEDIAAGNLDAQVTPKSDRDLVMIALGKAMDNLQGLIAEAQYAVACGGRREAGDPWGCGQVPGRLPGDRPGSE